MNQRVNLGEKSYDIVIEKGSLSRVRDYLQLDRKVMIVTDDGVPEEYSRLLAENCLEPVICRIPHGEENKDLRHFEMILEEMLSHGFGRKDCVAALGGGICGDLAGFAAASYMRGVDFYNLPTTVLAQVDSSIGGKTAVNLGGIKNVVGAFYQPKKVLIDVDVLKSLSDRLIYAGLAEALKMAVTFDEDLFRIFEKETLFCGEKTKAGEEDSGIKPPEFYDQLELIIRRALKIKGKVVEEDEKEQGLRKVLNFGHTVGHGIESQCLDGTLYHGECVALGMIPMCSKEIRDRLIPVLRKMNLATECRMDLDKVVEAMLHDKKAEEGRVTIVETDRIGSFHMRYADAAELREKAAMVVKGEYAYEYGF